jgi:hypothetical protein
LLKYVLRQIFKELMEDIHVYTNPIRKWFGTLPQPFIQYGRIGRWYRPYPFIMGGKYLRHHKHVIGLTGSGKSKLLSDMASQLIMQGKGVAVIDPHSDLSTDILIYLYQAGYFKDPKAYEKFLYIDFGIQDGKRSPTHFVPFNILKQSYDKYYVARGIVEAVKRVWPYLQESAPNFENVLLHAVLVLIENKLPLTYINKLLTNQSYRMKLLENVTDEMVVDFFLTRFDSWKYEQALKRESTLNKTTLMTLPPVLRYSLGSRDNLMDFRRIIDSGICVVFDLGGLDDSTQRFIGALLAVGFEEAALSRDSVIDPGMRPEYHLFLDEFDKFSAQSELTLSHILAQTRKFNLYLTLAHQTISQTTERLMGALQNTATFAFNLGHLDAPKMAPRFSDYDSFRVKHELVDSGAKGTRHPLYFTPNETHEQWAKALSSLWNRHLFVKINKRVWKIKTRTFPTLTVGWDTIESVKRTYADILMVKRVDIKKRLPSPPKEKERLRGARVG